MCYDIYPKDSWRKELGSVRLLQYDWSGLMFTILVSSKPTAQLIQVCAIGV